MTDDAPLRRTPLDAVHRALGARLVPFAGYEMPLNYPAGIVAEHLHCRARAALFDVSHMGQIDIAPRAGGVGTAAAALERLMPADLLGLAPGRQRYALLTGAAGGILDDLMVANLGTRLFTVVNAACKQADLALLQDGLAQICTATLLEDRALLALQGPEAGAVLARLAPDTAAMRFMDIRETALDGVPALVVRSGYTGEDGFEISLAASDAPALFERLLGDEAVAPAGLGARDTLRLEAGLCLMGSDMDRTVTPAEAGLDWAVARARRPGGARPGGFPGAARILDELKEGPERLRVGLLPDGRAPVRAGAVLMSQGAEVGTVTSGGFSPSLSRPIAMGRVACAASGIGTVLTAVQRGREQPVAVAPLPFVPARQKRQRG